MEKQTRRVLFAALLSLVVYGGTYYWYRSNASTFATNENLKPVAYVNDLQDEAHRRPASRLIWQSLNNGEALYAGETIRTSAQGFIRIQFSEKDRYIDLDPDSLVMISQNNNEISLDLMDGSLVVAGGNNIPGEKTLTLNSANGKVNLSGATASLSKNKTGQVDLQVIKGKAKLKDGKEFLNTAQVIKISSPKEGVPFLINPEAIEPVRFAWTGFPKGSQIELWLGPSRKELKNVAQNSSQKNSILDKKITSGRYFFKLVGVDPNTGVAFGESDVYRLEVQAKYPPTVISPTHESFFVMNQKENSVTFKWNKNPDTKKVLVEVAKDQLFKDLVASEVIDDRDSFTSLLGKGEFFWRVSAYYEGIERAFTTKALRLTIADKPKQQIVINWIGKDDKNPQYFVDKPQVAFAWDSPQKAEVKTWKLKVWPAEKGRDPASEDELKFETEKRELKVDVAGAGSYFGQLEAFNEYDTLLAKSEIRSIAAAVKPRLRAPAFIPPQGDLKADRQGKIELQWTPLQTAKEYFFTLFNKDGKELKKVKATGTKTAITNLLPGKYTVDIYAIDEHGRDSEKNKPRFIVVPNSSNILAPKLKKVRVN